MSPLAAPGRKVALLLGIAFLASLAFLGPVTAQNTTDTGNDTATDGGDAPAGGSGSSDLGVPADAPAPAEGKITRVLTMGVIEEGPCPGDAPAPCFDVTTFAANPGDAVVIHGNFLNSEVPHNIHAVEGVEGGPKSDVAGATVHTISFLMPESGEVRVVCDLHDGTMILDIKTPLEAAAGAGHAESVPSLGVNFLAYWVGVIAFAILFIVYGFTFFIFKYNETRATTDHFDRSDAPAESKGLAAVAPLLAVVLGIVAIAAVIFIAVR